MNLLKLIHIPNYNPLDIRVQSSVISSEVIKNFMPNLSNQAIQAALDQNWNEAIELNLSLLTDTPFDIATLNRLAFAYRQLGDFKKAKATYQRVIDLDQYNPIATKNLQKLSKVKTSTIPTNFSQKVITSFLEEPGKTKTVSLVRPADNSILLSLNPGSQVNLISKKRGVTVETIDHTYLGCLPDDVGHKLGKLINLGYKYQTLIKNTDNKSATIFITETQRSKRGHNLPSFSANPSALLNTPSSNLIEEIPIDTTPTGEEEQKD